MQGASASIADKNGDLQFYTDGFFINNRNDLQMPNGFGLNPGSIADAYAGYGNSYPSGHGSMIIPAPNQDSIYYMFQAAVLGDFSSPIIGYCNKLYYTKVDTRQQKGLGDIVDKNHLLIEDSLVGGGMAACKHANGRDWWVIMQELETNCFYKFLLTPGGVDSIDKQCIGDTLHFGYDRGSNVFTPDGNKYIWSNLFENLNIMDFDRCTGQFSNYVRIKTSDSLYNITHSEMLDGVAVSGNSRYLYLATGSQLRQFDLWANDIEQTEFLIDNTFQRTPQTYTMYCQLAPDGKVYINTGLCDTFLHVVNYPDSQGYACGFVRNGLTLNTYNCHYMPYYPNYRLGALPGSGCDTLNTGIKETIVEDIGIYPNPAGKYIIVDYGNLNWGSDKVELTIIDNLGSTIHRQWLPEYSAIQKIDVSFLVAGVYYMQIKTQSKILATGKFVRE